MRPTCHSGAGAYRNRRRTESDVRRAVERYADRADAPPEIVRWWEWTSAVYPEA